MRLGLPGGASVARDPEKSRMALVNGSAQTEQMAAMRRAMARRCLAGRPTPPDQDPTSDSISIMLEPLRVDDALPTMGLTAPQASGTKFLAGCAGIDSVRRKR